MSAIWFGFKWVDVNGRRSAGLSDSGCVEHADLVLGDQRLPIAAVVRAQARHDVIALEFVNDKGRIATVLFAVTSRNIERVQSALNCVASANREAHQRETAKGTPDLHLRFETCPHCGARVELTGRRKTPQAFCPYCERIWTLGADPDPGEARHRICEECGYYGSSMRFTYIIIWFAIVVWGWRSARKQVCRRCMRADAWEMLLVNVFLVVGVPFAVVALCRAYAGGKAAEGRFTGLGAANVRAYDEKVDDAVDRFREIEMREHHPAGVIYSRGLAHLQVRDRAKAAVAFREALSRCANYAPAYRQLAECLRDARAVKELEDLRTEWDDAKSWAEDQKAIAEAERSATARGSPA